MDLASTCQTAGKRHLQKIQQTAIKPSYLNHHLIKSNQIHSVKKQTAKKLYLILLQHKKTIPTSQKYFECMFKDLSLQWKHSYTLSHITTVGSKSQ